MFTPVEPDLFERSLGELCKSVTLPGGDDEVRRLGCCSMSPHRIHILGRPPPVALDRYCPASIAKGSPLAIRPAAATIFLVTKRSGRSGDSWLKRMPELACNPYASR